MSWPFLPIELIDLIVGLLLDDWRSLAACSLVDSTWTPLAFAHLSASKLTLEIDWPHCPDVDDFIRIFPPGLPISHTVSHLTIRGTSTHVADLLPLPDALDLHHLSQLTCLHLQHFLVHSLQTFSLFVLRCSALRELSIESVGTEMTAALQPLKPGPTMYPMPPNLSKLRIVDPPEMGPISFTEPLYYSLLLNESPAPLQSLMVHRPPPCHSWDAAARRSAETLTHLSITISVELYLGLTHLVRHPQLENNIAACPHLRDVTLRYFPETASESSFLLGFLGNFVLPGGPMECAGVLERLRLALSYSRPVVDLQHILNQFALLPRKLSKDDYPALSTVHLDILYDPNDREPHSPTPEEVHAFVDAVRSTLQAQDPRDAIIEVVAVPVDEWESQHCSLSAWSRIEGPLQH
ncbi:hypothetical protein PYCCODRAFT_1428599 [Trametes coccinea BRFM310]|uniref:F-box domain-containing protein n=1 Tax=Trametes coccinea (strain BRFM310) TaxID=1353009 RepID=A0A1Y2IBK3_TRAC3|nr:hypothetical protein PYCCODRAFT_1428599 [Trametes coccinea BRFM310]